jgi:WD40 repeat protein
MVKTVKYEALLESGIDLMTESTVLNGELDHVVDASLLAMIARSDKLHGQSLSIDNLCTQMGIKLPNSFLLNSNIPESVDSESVVMNDFALEELQSLVNIANYHQPLSSAAGSKADDWELFELESVSSITAVDRVSMIMKLGGEDHHTQPIDVDLEDTAISSQQDAQLPTETAGLEQVDDVCADELMSNLSIDSADELRLPSPNHDCDDDDEVASFQADKSKNDYWSQKMRSISADDENMMLASTSKALRVRPDLPIHVKLQRSFITYRNDWICFAVFTFFAGFVFFSSNLMTLDTHHHHHLGSKLMNRGHAPAAATNQLRHAQRIHNKRHDSHRSDSVYTNHVDHLSAIARELPYRQIFNDSHRVINAHSYIFASANHTRVPRPWLLNEVDAWLHDDESHVLVITADQGMGKSELIHELHGKYLKQGYAVLAHYASIDDLFERSVKDILSSLVLQLAHQLPAYAKHIVYRSQQMKKFQGTDLIIDSMLRAPLTHLLSSSSVLPSRQSNHKRKLKRRMMKLRMRMFLHLLPTEQYHAPEQEAYYAELLRKLDITTVDAKLLGKDSRLRDPRIPVILQEVIYMYVDGVINGVLTPKNIESSYMGPAFLPREDIAGGRKGQLLQSRQPDLIIMLDQATYLCHQPYELLSQLQDLVQDPSLVGRIKLVITSRPHPFIESIFTSSSISKIAIRADDDPKVMADLRRMLQANLNPSRSTEVVDGLARSFNGRMILAVSFVLSNGDDETREQLNAQIYRHYFDELAQGHPWISVFSYSATAPSHTYGFSPCVRKYLAVATQMVPFKAIKFSELAMICGCTAKDLVMISRTFDPFIRYRYLQDKLYLSLSSYHYNSFMSWISNRELAGRFYLDSADGHEAIVDYFSSHHGHRIEDKLKRYAIQHLNYHLQALVNHRQVAYRNIHQVKFKMSIVIAVITDQLENRDSKRHRPPFYQSDKAADEGILHEVIKKLLPRLRILKRAKALHQVDIIIELLHGLYPYLTVDHPLSLSQPASKNLIDLYDKLMTRYLFYRDHEQLPVRYMTAKAAASAKRLMLSPSTLSVTATSIERRLIGPSDWLTCVCQLADGRILGGSVDRKIYLWSQNDDSSSPINIFSGHEDWILALVALPDGSGFISASWDHSIRIWDNYGNTLKILSAHRDAVRSLVLLPNDMLASGGDDNLIIIWDLRSGKVLQVLSGHSSSVLALSVRADGSLVSGSWDSSIKLWSVLTGQCLRTLKAHKNGVMALASLSDGRLISASADETIRIWDADSWSVDMVLSGHSDRITSIAVLEDNRYSSYGHAIIVSASEDGSTKIWDLASGKLLHSLSESLNLNQQQQQPVKIMDVAILQDGKIITASRDRSMLVWAADLGEVIPRAIDINLEEKDQEEVEDKPPKKKHGPGKKQKRKHKKRERGQRRGD